MVRLFYFFAASFSASFCGRKSDKEKIKKQAVDIPLFFFGIMVYYFL